MDKQTFEQWFVENLDMMASLGIMHHNSPWGRTVRLSLAVNQPQIDALSARIAELEAQVLALQAKKKEAVDV